MTNQEQHEQPKIPTKEELIIFLKEQIEVKEFQSTLQRLNTDIATNRAVELEALAKISQYSQQNSQNIIQHKVTQEDMENNPSLSEQNVKVGDVIGIPKEAYEEFIDSKESEIVNPKVKSPLSVVK